MLAGEAEEKGQELEPMRFLFVMDPVERMIPDKDTTFAFIRGAEARGHECLQC